MIYDTSTLIMTMLNTTTSTIVKRRLSPQTDPLVNDKAIHHNIIIK